MSTDDHSPEGWAALHTFARQIGLQRSWFQEHVLIPHYDLVASKRRLAVKKGAHEVSSRDFFTYCSKKSN